MTISQHAERVNGTRPTPPAEPRRPTRAERLAVDAEAQARRAAILDDARRDRQRRAEEWADERAQLRADRKMKRSYTRSAQAAAWQARAARWWHAFVLVGAIVGVNVVAVVGQVTAFTTGFGWPAAQALATAAVIESIAIYVGWHAHVALIEGDTVMRLRVTSYAIAAGVGALNYHHYASGWKPTDTAVMFGAASLLSPWLWAMHSRHQHRQQLRAQSLIDPRAPKFSALRWILHKEETWEALKWAVRHGEQSPGAAIVAVQTDETTAAAAALLDRTRDDLVTAQATLIRAQADALTVTRMVIAELDAASGEVTAERSIESSAQTPELDPVPVTESVTDLVTSSNQASDRERPDDQDNRDAEKWIRAAMRKGRTPKLSDVRSKYPYSQGWAQARVRTARDQLTAQGYRFLPANRVTPPADPVASDDQDATDELPAPNGDHQS